MDGLRRFFRDEAATAEAASTVIMIAAVGILLAAVLISWYTGLHTSFNTAGSDVSALTGHMVSALPAAAGGGGGGDGGHGGDGGGDDGGGHGHDH